MRLSRVAAGALWNWIGEQARSVAHRGCRHEPGGYPKHAEFIEIIKDPVFRTKRVWHDFDYYGVEKMTGEEARDRLAEALVVVR